eukprot:GHVT01023822.1.p2 GENE.GHVT01023822.1~~GHVT01023822.1.p2  ORF type:complete len:107 (+),score=14.23 GHVT01023822.1:965-1285(+)
MRVGRCGVDGVLFCVFFLFFEGLNPVCVLQAAVVQAVDAMTPARRRANGISCSVGTPGSASYRRPSGNLSLGADSHTSCCLNRRLKKLSPLTLAGNDPGVAKRTRR